MNENVLYIWRIKTSIQNLACSQRQIHTVHTCRPSQAKTTKDIHANKMYAIFFYHFLSWGSSRYFTTHFGLPKAYC